MDYEVCATGSALFHLLPSETLKFSESLPVLGNSVRTASGALVTDVIAQKHEFSMSWAQIGYLSGANPLGGLGIENMRSLWETRSDLFLRVPRPNNTQDTYKVRWLQSPFQQSPIIRESNDPTAWYGSLACIFEEV